MNYISHLTAAIDKFSKDKKMKSTHVSLYLGLFYLWNFNRFNNPLSINRSEIMSISKVGAKVTYHKCLWELNNSGYIQYCPSHDSQQGSTIYMINFGTTDETTIEPTNGTTIGTTNRTADEQVVVHPLGPSLNSINNINITNNKKNTSFYLPSIDEVKIFFENDIEADKYFNYYSSKGWVVGNKSPMKDWKAAARNWKMNAGKFSSGKNDSTGSLIPSKGAGHLHVDQNKDYSIPL